MYSRLCPIKKTILLFVFVCILGNTPLLSYAQNPLDILMQTQNTIELKATPQYPRAGDTVELELISYSTDLNRSEIRWSVDGTIVEQGIAATRYTVQVGALGVQTIITARIITPSGVIIEKSYTIKPIDIDLIWQTTASTHPMYGGKALFPHEALIDFWAIPNNGTSQTAQELSHYVFTWKKDGETLGSFSGYGKNTFTYRGSYVSRPFTISVEVQDMNGIRIGEGSAQIEPSAGYIALYEESPVYGTLFNNTLRSFTLNQPELTITSVPLFFNIAPEPSSFKFTWSLNNTKLPIESHTLTIRNSDNISGRAIIGLLVQNIEKTSQYVNKQVEVFFNEN